MSSKYKPASQGGEVKEQQGRSNPLEGRTKTFFVEPGQRRIIVPLDDDLIPVRRHRLWLPKPPTTAIYGYRLTCAAWDPRQHDGLEPRICRACNAVAMGYTDPGISHPQVIWHATVIAEGELMRKDKATGREVPTGIFDYRYLLELDDKGKQMWEAKKATYGTLKGMRINAFRSMPPRGQKAKTPRYGESWDVLPGGPVDLRLHFWRSPAIPRLIEYSQRSGQGAVTHEQAVNDLITAINYDEEFDNYTEEAADRMVAIAAGKPIEVASAPAPGGYAAPPMPGGYAPQPGYQPAPQAPQGYAPPGYPPQNAPVDYSTQTMPTNQVPAYAPPPPPHQQQAAPPPVPDPNQGGQQPYMPPPPPAPQQPQAPAQQQYQPPPPPAQQQAPAAPPPQYQAPPPPAPQAPPQQQAPQAPAAPAAGYQFDRGWTPGFPQPSGQQPAPAAPHQQAAPPQPQQAPPPPPAQQPYQAPPLPAPTAPAPTHYDKPPF